MKKSRRTILMVDDVKFQLLSTRERLKKYCDIVPAISSEELFDKLGFVVPDMILLDVNMPEHDGFQILEKLKANELFAEIPVMFLTSKRDRRSILKAMNLGAVDFILKPFNDTELIDAIEIQLNPYRQKEKMPIILAVDDNPGLLKSLFFILEKQYNVYTLPDPEKIREILDMITPDLFILDCNMPVLNGFDLVPIIRKIPNHDDTPIVFLTSEGSVDNLSVAVHLGASDFLVKPIDDDELRRKAEKYLQGYMIRRRLRSI
jgi:putative two-component system response regulator